MYIDRNPPAVVFNCNTSVYVNRNSDFVTVPSECLINTVIKHLKYKVMEPSRAGITYVHIRPFSNSL